MREFEVGEIIYITENYRKRLKYEYCGPYQILEPRDTGNDYWCEYVGESTDKLIRHFIREPNIVEPIADTKINRKLYKGKIYKEEDGHLWVKNS